MLGLKVAEFFELVTIESANCGLPVLLFLFEDCQREKLVAGVGLLETIVEGLELRISLAESTINSQLLVESFLHLLLNFRIKGELQNGRDEGDLSDLLIVLEDGLDAVVLAASKCSGDVET